MSIKNKPKLGGRKVTETREETNRMEIIGKINETNLALFTKFYKNKMNVSLH